MPDHGKPNPDDVARNGEALFERIKATVADTFEQATGWKLEVPANGTGTWHVRARDQEHAGASASSSTSRSDEARVHDHPRRPRHLHVDATRPGRQTEGDVTGRGAAHIAGHELMRGCYADSGCPGRRACSDSVAWLRTKSKTATTNSASPVGPKGGGWAPMRNPERPSKTTTARGAPAWRRRAMPAAIIATTSPRPPMLPKTPKVGTKRMLGEGLDQVSPGCLVHLWKSLDLVDESANADPLQQLKGAVEDDEEHKSDPAHQRRGTLDAAHEDEDHGSEEGNEQHHSDVDDHPPGHLGVQVLVDLIALSAGVKEEQDRPGQRHANQKRKLLTAERLTLHRDPTLYRR